MSNRTATPKALIHWDDPLDPVDAYEREIFLEPELLAMVRLRVAQICDSQLYVNTHTEALRAMGESEERIALLKAWRESSLYSPRERIALAMSEGLGANPPEPLSDEAVDEARRHFNNAELLQLTLTIFSASDWSQRCVRLEPRR